MNKLGKKEILVFFPYYLEESARLEKEWASLREWQWVKQWQNLHARGKLNRWYEGKMKEWEL